MCEYLICVWATMKYVVQLLMVLIIFTDVHTLTVKYKYAYTQCLPCTCVQYVVGVRAYKSINNCEVRKQDEKALATQQSAR